MQENGLIENSVAKLVFSPDEYQYTREDFLGIEPYEQLFQLRGNSFLYLQEFDRLAEHAEEVKFKGFKKKMQAYERQRLRENRQNKALVPNQTEFDGQFLALNCGDWESVDYGIFRDTPGNIRECACPHPIMPIERLRNIDTGEVKVQLAFKRRTDDRWTTTIVSKKTIANSKEIISLAEQDVAVNSNNAKTLVAYLDDMLELNYDLIPQRKSIGRLGYIHGEGFSPYVDDLVFDGDASFRHLYNCVSSKGYAAEWIRIAQECRSYSTTAKIMLAASFASPLLSIVGALPFFVHLWGVDSGTGKTVALMLAASVWGDPALGSYTQTFNGTQVAQERTAAFLNHLPMCLDELQLTKNSKGQSNFDVYQLAQGVGRARGRKTGGNEDVSTWSCCFLTTGESPLTNISSGAGAVNRVIDIECTAGTVAVKDGHRVAGVLKANYGEVGRYFIERLYKQEGLEARFQMIREVYQNFFKELCAGDSTEKQAMAAAAILTADLLAGDWIFEDEKSDFANSLSVAEIKEFLASREAVSAGRRAYDWLCGWVSSNSTRFFSNSDAPVDRPWGIIENGVAYINKIVFGDAVKDAGFSTSATLSYLKSSGLIELRSDNKGYTKTKRVNGIPTDCVALKMQKGDDFEDEGDLLPL